MKTYKSWADDFFTNTEAPFIGIDEQGVNQDYGTLNTQQRDNLFTSLEQNSSTTRRWASIKRYFNEFYDDLNVGDIIAVGVGQTSKFNVAAIVRITSGAYYVPSTNVDDIRHRRNVEVIWIDTQNPLTRNEWGWSNRIAKMDTVDRLKEFMETYINLTS